MLHRPADNRGIPFDFLADSVAPNDKFICHPERSSLRGCEVEGSPTGRRRAGSISLAPKFGGSFDSLADSLAPNDTNSVTLSGAASEAAESKGPQRVGGAPFLSASLRNSGDPSTLSRTRSLRMTRIGCLCLSMRRRRLTAWASLRMTGIGFSVIPGVGAASLRGGAQGDMGGNGVDALDTAEVEWVYRPRSE